MPLKTDQSVTPQTLVPQIERLFELSAGKILGLEKSWNPDRGAPVFTARGRYTTRGWTEWTQGFQSGMALLQFDATGDPRFLELGRRGTHQRMASHVSHIGVHDHGFNIISTYGNLRRLLREGKTPFNEHELGVCELALKVSGAIQAARWTPVAGGGGFIYSFNGPHSLFIDTMRSLRSLGLGHQLGHVLMGERDRRISLLERLVQHAQTTARFSICYGEGRDRFDVRGRTAQEAIFNTNDGTFRCPCTQQGYSPYTTWTRGLAWGLSGFAEQLELVRILADEEIDRALAGTAESGDDGVGAGGKASGFRALLLRAALASADYYLENCCADGVPMWDTGAPNLHRLGTYGAQPADPFNEWEPVDSSAAAIAAQGLLRLGAYMSATNQTRLASRYRHAGLTIARTLLFDPYLSSNPKHQGILLHSVYHRPNGWDYVAGGQKVPNGESSMWGDYHLLELGVLIWRLARNERYLAFFDRP